MVDSVRVFIILGFCYWAISLYEFLVNRENSGALLGASIYLFLGFGGLFIYNRLKDKF